MQHTVNEPSRPHLATEAQAAATPAVREVSAAFDADPGPGKMTPHNLAMLMDVCADAGVTVGAFDSRILAWLAGWEPSTCAVVAGLITRAHAGSNGLTPAQLATVLDALDVAADYKRDRVATCPDCEASPAELCGTCEWRLTAAEGFDALAVVLRGQR
jgi:hypothetical protein